tara:strand:+ start:7682 stop:7912 length:231 start_codon:yes stop_codon:yes gene_type:complete
VAKGLLGVGTLQKKQALQGLTQAAGLEAQQDIANEQLFQQRKAAKAQTTGALTAIGAAVGGPVGAAIGFLAGRLFG